MATTSTMTHALATGYVSDDCLLVAGTEHGVLTAWDFASGREHGFVESAHGGSVSALGFQPSSPRPLLASGGGDGLLKLWTPELKEVAMVELGEPIGALVWLSEDRLAVGTDRGLVVLQLALG